MVSMTCALPLGSENKAAVTTQHRRSAQARLHNHIHSMSCLLDEIVLHSCFSTFSGLPDQSPPYDLAPLYGR